MIITIDGPVATGKSTIAKKLAASMGYIYFDTGAMYRSATYAIMNQNIALDDTEALKNFLNNFDFHIKILRGERRYFVGKEDVTDKIRSEKVSIETSHVSANPLVREKMVEFQRKASSGVNAVFEGRDMGTIVFPQADLKIFLTGREDVRAQRRYNELVAKFPAEAENLTMAKVLEDLNERDRYDSEREASPLKCADDAFKIDTSDLTPDEIVFKILECKDIASARRKK